MFYLTKQKLIRLLFWGLVVLPGIPFVVISLAISIYVYWPRDFSSVTEFPLVKNVEYITLSAHGVNDTTASWSDELQQLMATSPYSQLANVVQQNHSIDWQKFSSNVFMCSVAGKKIGIEMGKHLATMPSLKAIHAIGHSCGSFITLGICEGAKSVNPQLMVQTTYLDPVSVYSGVFWNYGIEHFGSCGDFSDNYIDTRDTVPGSNQALANSYTFDVTQQQTTKDADVPPHAWPTRYYLQAYRNNSAPLLYKADLAEIKQFKKGEMTQIITR
ncbi:hypothetical protein [Paraglaciecola sp. L3A3]|uniref:hypothetical protein n=1 Tax=Paraglaciecola sp. L3A3 TaxID=2686358 RepID=UPI001E416FF6|nr:hypothetical protein [Paraglaciecola sp. L3A3]